MTPFEREILTHHYVSPEPFPRQTPLYWDIVDRMVGAGLLRRHLGDVSAVEEPLRVYMDALEAVPLPVQVWVIQ